MNFFKFKTIIIKSICFAGIIKHCVEYYQNNNCNYYYYYYCLSRFDKNTYTPFTAWVFKKEILQVLQGFDPDSGIEDLDLGKRLLSAGYHITYQPDAVCYHDGEPKTLLREIKRSGWVGSEMAKCDKKNPDDRGKEFYPFLLFLLSFPAIFYRDIFMAILITLITIQSLKFYLIGMQPIYSISEAFLSIIRKWFYTLALFLEDT